MSRAALAAGRRANVRTAISRYSRMLVAVRGHADVAGLQRRDPAQLLDAVLDLALVGGRGRALLQQQLLRHPLIDAGAWRQGQGVDDRRRAS